MKYKLIKRFPGSPPVGTIVEKHYPDPEKAHFCYKGTYTSGISPVSFTRARNQIEGFEEFWQSLTKSWRINSESLISIRYSGGSSVSLVYPTGNTVIIPFGIIKKLINDPFNVDKVAGFKVSAINVNEAVLDHYEGSLVVPKENYEYFIDSYIIGCTAISYNLVKEIYEWIKSN